MKFLKKENFEAFAKKISRENDIFYPEQTNGSYRWKKNEGESFSLEGHRTVLPMKYFFFPPGENLKEKERKPAVIFGARGCDLRGLALLKKIYLEEPEDIYFRKDILIFSADCTSAHKDCFCAALGDEPWAEEGFDLNFSFARDGYIVEAGSDKGSEILKNNSGLFEDASNARKREILEVRQKTKETVLKQNGGKNIKPAVIAEKIEKNTDVLAKYAEDCVSCGACTNVCPACFCFFLSEGENNKIRYSDSCQYPGYARVAGGANPRKEMTPRFKHRFLCKFFYRPAMQEIKGCTGCGRCIDGCQGGINFMDVLADIAGAAE
ncbi:MAG: 4Fe-4S dicluster domain-containing protein [Elusimicrobia bacterium]|nr:4Fe-4S dicluster domain-containing protein [Elusimicrobiota bacterium]